MEAAKALGLKRAVIWRRIILPQVFAVILPPLTNEFTMLVKASPLLSVITVVELTRTAQQIMDIYLSPGGGNVGRRNPLFCHVFPAEYV